MSRRRGRKRYGSKPWHVRKPKGKMPKAQASATGPKKYCVWYLKGRGVYCSNDVQPGMKYCQNHVKAMKMFIQKRTPQYRYNNPGALGGGYSKHDR